MWTFPFEHTTRHSHAPKFASEYKMWNFSFVTIAEIYFWRHQKQSKQANKQAWEKKMRKAKP